MTTRPEVTRLAPSPTGALHLGNARTFLANWALARKNGWRVLLRIEDLDGPRVKPGAAEGLQAALEWLGVDWDEGPLVQSADLAPYRAAMERLAERGLAFPCALTRTQIARASSAPQEGAHELRCDASLRPRAWSRSFGEGELSWRLAVPPGPVAFQDAFYGAQAADVSRIVGDFVVWTKRRTPSYQLAVVVDDHRQGVTRVVRGADLLDSAARQLLLYRALGQAPEPGHCHLPLVVGPDAKRLAKRHGDSRLERYRGLGVPVEAVIGLLARWCGVREGSSERFRLSAAEFRAAFELARVPKEPVVFTLEDDAWLLSQAV